MPINIDRLKQIATRLIFNFNIRDLELSGQYYKQFMSVLSRYPDDLVCAAYLHCMRRFQGKDLPDISYFIEFIEPEYERRLEQKVYLKSIVSENTTGELECCV
jgi:hypothetical protein